MPFENPLQQLSKTTDLATAELLLVYLRTHGNPNITLNDVYIELNEEQIQNRKQLLAKSSPQQEEPIPWKELGIEPLFPYPLIIQE